MTKVLFLDLETTGLNPKKDQILEVGAILYDLKEEKELAVVHAFPGHDMTKQARYGARIDRVVYKMHTDNGLWNALLSGEESGAAERAWSRAWRWERDVLEMIAAHFTKGECMMAGRSPSFDRRFLAKYAPDLDAFLSHRMIDVSTLTQLSKAWGPEKAEDVTKKADPHRALEDCREAIKTLLKYRPVFASFDLHPERANKTPT